MNKLGLFQESKVNIIYKTLSRQFTVSIGKSKEHVIGWMGTKKVLDEKQNIFLIKILVFFLELIKVHI